jgi:hypothetical protein
MWVVILGPELVAQTARVLVQTATGNHRVDVHPVDFASQSVARSGVFGSALGQEDDHHRRSRVLLDAKVGDA